MSVDEVKSWFPSYSVVASFGSNKSCGVAVLFKSSFSLLETVGDSSGSFVRAHLSRADTVFDVVSLYAPNLQSDRFVFRPYCPFWTLVFLLFCVEILIQSWTLVVIVGTLVVTLRLTPLKPCPPFSGIFLVSMFGALPTRLNRLLPGSGLMALVPP